MGRLGEVNRILKGKTIGFFMAGLLLLLSGCQTSEDVNREQDTSETASAESSQPSSEAEEEESASEETGEDSRQEDSDGDYVTEGTEEYRGFTLDNVLHSQTEGDIHYNLYIPDSYDGEEPCAIFFTLPGYEGLYFQGVGENLYSEDFGFEAQNYDPDMIIVAPQLSDWGETSADQTIALVEYFLENYNIDPDRVYGEGYSGGGETMSQVMGKRPDLFTAYLQCSSQWDGDYESVVENRMPVYFVIGESDKYYGSQPTQEAYDNLYELYRQDGLSDEEISQILVLDIKDADYFESQGVTVQHGGGNLFARDQEIMNWLFSKQK